MRKYDSVKQFKETEQLVIGVITTIRYYIYYNLNWTAFVFKLNLFCFEDFYFTNTIVKHQQALNTSHGHYKLKIGVNDNFLDR